MRTENNHILKILKTHDEIVQKTIEVANKLNDRFKNEKEEVVLLLVLKGSLPYALELMKHLNFDVSIDFITSSSYFLNKKISDPKIKYEPTFSIENKKVIIIEDLIDSGHTIKKLCKEIIKFKPSSITITAIYGKPSRIKTNNYEIFCWEEDPKEFLIGFGLDYDEKYRNLPYIAIIKGKK